MGRALGFFALVITVASAAVLVACGAGGDAPSTATATSTATVPSHSDPQIENLQTALAQATSPAARANIQGKLNVYERDRASELHARSQAPDGISHPDAKFYQQATTRAEDTTTPYPVATVVGHAAGNGTISDYPINELPGSIFHDLNAWVTPLNPSTNRFVMAGDDGNGGAPLSGPAQGELWVSDEPTEVGVGRAASKGFFKPDGPAHGALRVTGATGDVLTLQATDGTVYYFDAANLKFVTAP